jgi:hypothetical protein
MNLDEIRALSAALYGNLDRLRAAAAIGRLEGKPISVTSVAAESGLDFRRAQEQVAWFRDAGVLILDLDRDSRKKNHRAADISYWRSAVRLEAEFVALEDLNY